jgi:hypothetical protein
MRSVVLVQHARPGGRGAVSLAPLLGFTYSRRQLLAKAAIAASRVSA